MSQTYPEGIVKDLIDIVEDTLTAYKSTQEELNNWKKKAQEVPKEKVILEKVAATLDKHIIHQTLDYLENHAMIDPGDVKQREKMASFLEADPNNALLLAQRILQFSTPALSEGRGVSKSASAKHGSEINSTDAGYPEGWLEDGWDKVLSKGA